MRFSSTVTRAALWASLSTSTTWAFAPSRIIRPYSTTALFMSDLSGMTVKELKQLVRDSDPPAGIMSKLTKKTMLVDYIQSRGLASITTPEPKAAVVETKEAPAPVVEKKVVEEVVEEEEVVSSSGSDEGVMEKVQSIFPGAVTNSQLMSHIGDVLLKEAGYDLKSNTLVATCLCCDEVNRPLEADLKKLSTADHFNMGGLAGFPFGGKTAFGAMAAHIPDNGNCLIVHGPHVGVDRAGNVGTVERRGKVNGGSCCGSAIAAKNIVTTMGEQIDLEMNVLDAQQSFVNSLLSPHASRLVEAREPMKELPHALYDTQAQLVKDIVTSSTITVGAHTAVLGGIQINTPPEYEDAFLVQDFSLYDNEGNFIKDLTKPKIGRQSFPPAIQAFPGAITNMELLSKVQSALDTLPSDTLLATSLCCDEVNRPLEQDLASVYGTNFHMGGLAGFPFGGATSFGAMTAHIPDGGSCLVVYGPHVGVDSTGKVGTVERLGKANGGSCCGSAVAAAGFVGQVHRGEMDNTINTEVVDAQQSFVNQLLLPHAGRLEEAENSMVELPYALYDAQSDLLKQIVSNGANIDGTIAVLGGIQINTPPDNGYDDYFLPLSFVVYDKDGNEVKDLFWDTFYEN